MKVINNTESNISFSAVVQRTTAFFAGKQHQVVAGVKAVVFKPGVNDVDISIETLKEIEGMKVIQSHVAEGSLRIEDSKSLEALYNKRKGDIEERLKRFTKGLKDSEANSSGESKKVKALEGKIASLEAAIKNLSK